MSARPLFRVAAVCALAGMLATTSSCSWIVMRAAPDPPVRTEPECSTTRIPAVLDLSLGIPYLVIGVLFLVLAKDEEGTDKDIFQAAGATAAIAGGVYTWSGMSGLRMAGECRAAEAEYEEWVNNPQSREPKRNPWETQTVRPGSEGGACVAVNRCEPGLTCASGFCVKLP